MTPIAKPAAGRTVEPLPLPEGIAPLRIRWDQLGAIALVHVLSLAVLLPGMFSWPALIACIVCTPLFGILGINLCYHRLLTHRSLRVPRWLEYTFVTIALCSLEGTPVSWVATHRLHHSHTDERPDPHSPLVTFFWAHMGWLIYRNPGMRTREVYAKYARDLLGDPFYYWIEKRPVSMVVIYLLQLVAFFGVTWGVALIVGKTMDQALMLGLSMCVWAVFLRTVLVWHITWSVNSLTHLFGYQNYETGENSRNNWLVGLIAMGEGWHNNHHHDAASATVQMRWWEIDLTYYVIKLLQWVGLATDVVQPRAKRLAHHAPSQSAKPTAAADAMPEGK